MNKLNLKNILAVAFFLTFALQSNAQIGARIGYHKNHYNQWDKLSAYTTNNKFHSSSFEFGVNTWFRLPKHRVEFLPEFVFGSMNGTDINYVLEEIEFDHQFYDLRLNTQFYILDFFTECDCPTFGDQRSVGNGLFLSTSPGIRYSSKSINERNSSRIILNWAFGMGYDIAINKEMNITPILGYRFNLNDQWKDQSLTLLNINNEKSWGNIEIGIRFSYKPIKNKRQRGLFK